MRFGQGASEHGKVLGVGVGEPAVNLAIAGNHSVAEKLLLVEPKKAASVGHKGPELFKGTVVKEELKALSGSQLFLLVLGVNSRLSATELRFGALCCKRF